MLRQQFSIIRKTKGTLSVYDLINAPDISSSKIHCQTNKQINGYEYGITYLVFPKHISSNVLNKQMRPPGILRQLFIT